MMEYFVKGCDSMAEKHLNEKFIDALKYMNTTMKADIKAGHQWKYCNTTSKKAKSFAQARKQGKYLINCVDGVQWALKIAGVPAKALSWYGGDGKIVWCNKNAKAEAKKYFDIIPTKGKSVLQLYNAGLLCDGDILLGYRGCHHTNAYVGNGKSFDSGGSWAKGSGEGARFTKWIGALAHKSMHPVYILRLKDRAHYRVQAGAYETIEKYNEQIKFLASKGYKNPVKIVEDGMYKVQLGYYSGKTNANKFVAKLKKKGINAFVKEIV